MRFRNTAIRLKKRRSTTTLETSSEIMDAYKAIQLVGACLAMIVGTLVFLVVFFRSMSWIDHWIKGRNGLDVRRRRGKGKRTNDPNRQVANERVNQGRKQPTATLGTRKAFPSRDPIPSQGSKFASRLNEEKPSNGRGPIQPLLTVATASESHALSTSVSTVASTVDLIADSIGVASLQSKEPLGDMEVLKEEAGHAVKTVRRIATVHLLSGETIERVGFCSNSKASKICEGLGFEGIVFEGEDGQISVVRECNIKMVTWKAV